MKNTINLSGNLMDLPDKLADDDLFLEIIWMETRFWSCTGTEGGLKFIEDNFADNGQITVPSDAGFWVSISKEQFKETTKPKKHTHKFSYRHIDFKQLTENTVMINYNLADIDCENDRWSAMVCNVYQKDKNGLWRVILCQQYLPYSQGFDNKFLENM